MRSTLIYRCMALWVAWMAATSAGTHGAAPALEYPVHHLTAAPVMDGKIEGDPAWTGVPEATGFFRLGGGYTAGKQTAVRLGWHDDALYLAVRCEEPDIAEIAPRGSDGGDLWSEDSVEVFVQPSGANRLHQFVVTTGGARRGAGASDGSLNWQAAVARSKESYTLEIALPFALLGETPRPGAVWHGNVARNIVTTISGGDKYTTWSPLHTAFAEPERFYGWRFLAQPPEAAAVDTVEIRLNDAYRQFLRGKVEQLVQQSDVYLPTLRQACTVPQLATSANALVTQWEALLRAHATAVPLSELRQAASSGADLVQRSKQAKYDYLFWQLFNT